MAPALKDSFYSRKDRHISHTIDYNYNKKQIVLSVVVEVVQIKCSGDNEEVENKFIPTGGLCGDLREKVAFVQNLERW